MRSEVLPTYGNTHTLASKTGRQSSEFVAESRQMIKEYLKCNSDRSENADQLLFVGSGSTACANHLVRLLGLEASSPEARARARALPEEQRPVVFVGPYEHHSNLLPWRDSTADVVQVGEAVGGGPDLVQLEALLQVESSACLAWVPVWPGCQRGPTGHWPRLAGARGRPEHALARRGASGEPET